MQDRFARGLINSSKRQRLLAERALALKTAIDLAKTLESAEVETKLIFTDIKTENPFIIKEKSRRYYRCNSDEHLANTCLFKECLCNTCKMKDHLSKVCRKGRTIDFSRTQMVTPRNRNRLKNYNLEETDDIKCIM